MPGGPSETADFILFRSQMLGIYSYALVRFTVLHDLNIFLSENIRREFKSHKTAKQKTPKKGVLCLEGPVRLELTTCCLKGSRSNQLSYGPSSDNYLQSTHNFIKFCSDFLSLSSSRCNKQTSEVLVCSIVEEKRRGYVFIDFKVFCIFYNPNIISFFR